MPAAHTGTGSCHGCSTSHLIFWKFPGRQHKMARVLGALPSSGKIWKKHLFLAWHSPGCVGYLRILPMLIYIYNWLHTRKLTNLGFFCFKKERNSEAVNSSRFLNCVIQKWEPQTATQLCSTFKSSTGAKEDAEYRGNGCTHSPTQQLFMWIRTHLWKVFDLVICFWREQNAISQMPNPRRQGHDSVKKKTSRLPMTWWQGNKNILIYNCTFIHSILD